MQGMRSGTRALRGNRGDRVELKQSDLRGVGELPPRNGRCPEREGGAIERAWGTGNVSSIKGL